MDARDSRGGPVFAKLRPRSPYDVLAVIGCFAGLTTGGANAADTIGSSDVIDESLLSQDFQGRGGDDLRHQERRRNDFSRDITVCTALATIGNANTNLSNGEVNVADRLGNVEAVVVGTNTTSGNAADRPFRLVVVC